MRVTRKLARWLVQSWAGFLVPFYYAKVEWRHGTVCLFTSRFGVKRWEVYAFGSSLLWDEFCQLMRPLKYGTTEWYHRLQNLNEYGRVCRLLGRFKTWQEARNVDLRRHDVQCPVGKHCEDPQCHYLGSCDCSTEAMERTARVGQ